MPTTQLHVALPEGGFARTRALAALRGAGLPDALAEAAAGPFGHSSGSLATLEGLLDATDQGLAAAAALEGLILAEAAAPGSLAVPALSEDQRRLTAALQLVVSADAAGRRLAEIAPAPDLGEPLELDGLSDLLLDEPDALARRVLRLARLYLQAKRSTTDTESAASGLAAFFALVRDAVLVLSDSGSLRPLVAALATRDVRIAGRRYEGLEVQQAREAQRGLLSIRPEQIVGNDAYLQAGLRLARDVAGYDLAARSNPKQLNPVLFGLGRPGCGKTVTAHAIGNTFLDHCAARDVPARFVVVRRTDWASSYQNASALNLVRIFEEEVYGFDGVCGVYWPDIDTAFASRSSDGLRMEEKQNLGAVFGIFDGTLLPHDGKWFLICDANTLRMDEATVSRIASNPFDVTGPTEPAHYVTLMRDVLLADVAGFVRVSGEEWLAVGRAAAADELSGRNVKAVCNNVRSAIQDFEYPDAWFSASSEAKEDLLAELCQTVGATQLHAEIERGARFSRDAEARADAERFEAEVDELTRRLNASRAAAERVAREGTP